MQLATLLFGTVLLAVSCHALGDPPAGEPDPSFGSFDNLIPGLQLEGFFEGGDYDDRAFAAVVDAAGRFVLAGSVATDAGDCLGLMRFMPDGQLDTQDFGTVTANGTSGKICHPLDPPNQALIWVRSTLSPDGDLFVASITQEATFVCRFDAKGNAVAAFSGGCRTLMTGAMPPFLRVNVLVSGDTVLVISHQVVAQTLIPVLFRLNRTTGAIQPQGQQDGVPMLDSVDAAHRVAFDAILVDDAVIVAGGSFGNSQDAFISRFDLQANATDTNFSGDGLLLLALSPEASHLATLSLLDDGTVMAAGAAIVGDHPNIVVTEIDAATGAFSPKFNGGAPKVHDPCTGTVGCGIGSIRAVSVTATRIGVAGFGEGFGFVTQLARNGEVDTNFANQGFGSYPFLSDATALFEQNGRFVVTGYGNNGDGDADFALMRLSDGRVFNDEFESNPP